MRILGLTIAVVVGSVGAARAETRSPIESSPVTESALTLAEIDQAVKPVSTEISNCYLDAAASVRGAGHLVVQLAIHRRGMLDGVRVATPGLPAKVARKIEACVRGAVAAIEFPERRTATTAVVPYYFQHTVAPNAGPQPSCWRARGCPGR